MEQEIGRKLTFKEKMALKVVKRKMKRSAQAKADERETEGFAILGFIAGLASIFIFGIIIRILLGILGIVFGGIALSNIKKAPETKRGKGLAILGLILGILGIAVTAAIVFAFAAG